MLPDKYVRNPATVGEIPVEPWRDALVASSLSGLRKEIRRGMRRGEFAGVGPIQYAQPGMFACAVVRIREPRPPRPPWMVPVAAGVGVVGTLAAGGWLLYLAVAAALSAVAGAGLAILGTLAALLVLASVVGGGATVVEVFVRVRR